MRQMKDSGIEWIGQIPEEWEVRQLKYAGIISGGTGFPIEYQGNTSEIYPFYKVSDLELSSDGKFFISFQNSISEEMAKKLKARIIRERSIIYAKIGAALLLNRRRISLQKCIIDNNMSAFTPYQNVNLFFVYYLFLTLDFKIFILSGTIPSFSEGDQSRIYIPFPSLNEQQRIADYLDAQCARIDETMELVRQSREKLRAYKLSLITEAVTKGLDPDVPMKDSGFPWIGEIPAGWNIYPLAHCIASIESGISVNSGYYPASENEIGILKTSCVLNFSFNINENKSVNYDEYDRIKCPVKKDCLIISRMNTPNLVGACGYVEKSYPNIFLPDRLWQISIKNDFHSKFIYYYIISMPLRAYFFSISTGTSGSMKNISQKQLSTTPLLCPPLPEQQRIAAYLDEKCARIDALLAEKDELLDKLAEYKKSLIFECVTGKREVAA